MNSNGTLVPDCIDNIRELDFLKLSLDGPKSVHDLLRGKGSYEKVIKAADVCHREKIKFGFACTLTKYNINKSYDLVRSRLKRGWSVQDALYKPTRKGNYKNN